MTIFVKVLYLFLNKKKNIIKVILRKKILSIFKIKLQIESEFEFNFELFDTINGK